MSTPAEVEAAVAAIHAAVVVCADAADLAWAAQRCATFAMYQAGQSCVSVQRVLVLTGIPL